MLACKLAREAVFGEEVKRRYTPMGNREHNALPSVELKSLKGTIFTHLSHFFRDHIEFEPVWEKWNPAILQTFSSFKNLTVYFKINAINVISFDTIVFKSTGGSTVHCSQLILNCYQESQNYQVDGLTQ